MDVNYVISSDTRAKLTATSLGQLRETEERVVAGNRLKGDV